MKYCILLLLTFLSVYSQELIIHQKNGNNVDYNIEDIQKLTFDLSDLKNLKPENIPKFTKIFSKIYPNPFSSTTKIQYKIVNKCRVAIAVYDMNGKMVNNIQNKIMEAGTHLVTWNGKNSFNKKLANGLYICKIKSNNNLIKKKMFLIK